MESYFMFKNLAIIIVPQKYAELQPENVKHHR